MINDIIVNLSVGAKANSASDYAISLAAALNAHLTGIIFLYGPTMPVSRTGYVPPELEVLERHNEAAVKAAHISFLIRQSFMRVTVVPTPIGFSNVRNCCVRFCVFRLKRSN